MRQEKISINENLSGILTYPENIESLEAKLPAVLLLHGFGTDKNEVNSIFVDMASILQAHNIVSLRIDFRGYGESQYKTEDASVDTMVSDANSAFQHLCNLPYVDPNSVGIVGFSLGAAVAMLSLNNSSCHSLALLSPASNLVDDFTAFLGKPVMEELSSCNDFIEIALPWRNIKIGRAFYDSLCANNPLISLKKHQGPLLCIAGEKDFSCGNAKAIYSASVSENKSIDILNEADHILCVPGGKSLLLESATQICSWFKTNLSTESCTKENTRALHV